MHIKTPRSNSSVTGAAVNQARAAKSSTDQRLIDRMRSCVSRDRLDALVVPDQESVLAAVSDDCALIRNSLSLCQRIRATVQSQ